MRHIHGRLWNAFEFSGLAPELGKSVLSESVERTQEYLLAANKLRALAEAAQYPEIRAELLWLAQSYERLAGDPTMNRIVDGFRSLEMREP
jgi:hypothetical protein